MLGLRPMSLAALSGISGLVSLKAKRRSGWRVKRKGAANSSICPWSPASRSVPAEEPTPAGRSS